MPEMWIDVDTAVAVPVNILPLIDDGDFKTREVAIVYNSTDMDLVWNFVTSAGVMTTTTVTPTTGGVYDWIESGTDEGMYKLEIPASGGATINNDAEGYGWFSGICNGVLPWRGPVMGFRAAAINDALCDGGDLLDVTTDAASRTASKATGFSTHDAVAVKTEIEGGGSTLALIKAVTDVLPDSGALTTIGTDTARLTAVRAAVLTDWINAGRLDTILDAIKTVTDALTVAAATKLAFSAGTMVTGTVSWDNTNATTSIFYVNDITEATANHYKGRIVLFTSGDLEGQATDITAYALDTGEGKFTVTALTEAPADNVTFIIV